MAVKLSESSAAVEPQTFTLSEVERVSYKRNGTARTLAVAQTPDKRAYLCRVTSKPVKDGEGKRPKQDASGKDRAREEVLTRTPALADIADAMREGLIEP